MPGCRCLRRHRRGGPSDRPPFALAGIKDLFDTIEKAKKYFNPKLKILGIVINQADGRKLIMEREMEEALREAYGSLVFKTRINKRVKLEESPSCQEPITQYYPKGPSAKEFNALVKECLQRLEPAKKQLPVFEND